MAAPPDDPGAAPSKTETSSSSTSRAVVRGLLKHKLGQHDSEAVEIHPGLWLGSSGCLENAADRTQTPVQRLESDGFTHVVACAAVPGVDLASATNLRTLELAMKDDGKFEELEGNALSESTMNFIDDAVAAEGGKCLVYCLQGKSRSVSVVIGWLLLRGKVETVDDALVKIREQRPQAAPNMGFVLCLKKLERRLAGTAEASAASGLGS